MTPYYVDGQVTLLQGDVRAVLRELPGESVHCVVTSPPYWGLRDYGIPPSVWGGQPDHEHKFRARPAKWYVGRNDVGNDMGGGRGGNYRDGEGPTRKLTVGQDCSCGAWLGALGLEHSPALYIEHLVEVFSEVWRVLRKDGTLWLNMGDSYAAAGGHSRQGTTSQRVGRSNLRQQNRGTTALPRGYKPKDMIGVPWLAAFALQEAGWWLRSDIIWSKPNPMPESVTDRPTKSHEYLFLLAKAERYYYDAEAIREPYRYGRDHHRNADIPPESHMPGNPPMHSGLRRSDARVPSGWDTGPGARDSLLGRNPRRSGNLERKTHKNGEQDRVNTHLGSSIPWEEEPGRGRNRRTVWEITTQPYPEAHFATFPPALVSPCIAAGCPPDGTVLDPFAGSGTTCFVAKEQGRKAIGVDLKPEFLDLAVKRCQQGTIWAEAL